MTAIDIQPEWRLGGPAGLLLTDAPFAVPFGGVDYGKPNVVRQILETAMSRGDYDIVTRTGNRVVTLPVLIEESDFAAHGDAEKLLQAECDKPFNEVYCDPGDGFGPPFIFEVFQGELTFTRSDEYEQNGFRLYALTFPARPFPRSVDRIALTPTGTNVLTAKQKLYEIAVEGSAATHPDLHVGSASALGVTLIYTRPGGGGFIPLRQHKTAGNSTTNDATQVSGKFENISSAAFIAEVPKEDVPDGTYVLIARAGAGGTSKTVAHGVSTQTAGFDLTAPATGSATATWDAAGTVVQLGQPFQIPGAACIDPANSTVKVAIQATAPTVFLDEAWLVEIGTGALTWVDSAPTTSGMVDAKHFWLEEPMMERPARRIIKGAFSDQTFAFGASPIRWGEHEFKPGVNSLAMVTTATTTAALDLTYPPRWAYHAGTV